MRVKIGYTVNLEELPSEVSKFLRDHVQRVESLKASYQDIIKEENITKSLEMIDTFRLSLTAIDQRLDDAAQMLESYQTLLASELLAKEIPDKDDADKSNTA